MPGRCQEENVTGTIEGTTQAVLTKTALIDEFLSKHSVALPTHIIDFALDVRAVVAELEELLKEPQPASL